MTESFVPPPNPKIEKLESEIATLKLEDDLLKTLINKELHNPDEKLPEHIPKQIASLRQNLGINNQETIKSLIEVGLGIDIETEQNTGRGELALLAYDDLNTIIRQLYASEFPNVSDIIVQKIIGKAVDAVDTNHDVYFIDALITEINQVRAEFIRTTSSTTYFVEGDNTVHTTNPRQKTNE